jgi:hypothetical protein
VATDAQTRANRENALRSTGPRSLEGKAASSQNALKHGLTASGDVLLAEDAAIVEERTEAFRASLRPTDERVETLVRQMAADAIRADRCWQLTQLMILRYADRARSCWDLDRRAEAEDLAARLPREPARTRAALRATRYGCEVMIERWDALGPLASRPGGWDAARRSMALDLLGVHPELRDGPTPIDPPDGADPAAFQQALAAAEASRLRALQSGRLDAWDADERAIAETGLGAEFSRPLTTLRRYESALQRRWSASHRYFLARDRAGSGDGKVADASPAPTPAPTPPAPPPRPAIPRPVATVTVSVAAPVEGAGTAAAPARPLTRRQRKYLAQRERESQRGRRAG